MFHSSAGFWEFLSLSVKTPPFPFSFSGFNWFQWAVPMFIDWRSIWYCLSSTSDPGSRSIPRFSAFLECQREKKKFKKRKKKSAAKVKIRPIGYILRYKIQKSKASVLPFFITNKHYFKPRSSEVSSCLFPMEFSGVCK